MKTSLRGFHQDQSLNLGFFREEATCFWTSCSSLAECLQSRLVQSLLRRFWTMSPVPKISLHFGKSQCDSEMLKRIVQGELADELDLVVDDASHTYEETRASFELLFPLLSPGGIYVIEDWSWAHHPDYQSPDAPFSNRRALSNLLFEQIMLIGSTLLISEIRVLRFLYIIHKAKTAARRSDMSQNVERLRFRPNAKPRSNVGFHLSRRADCRDLVSATRTQLFQIIDIAARDRMGTTGKSEQTVFILIPSAAKVESCIWLVHRLAL